MGSNHPMPKWKLYNIGPFSGLLISLCADGDWVSIISMDG